MKKKVESVSKNTKETKKKNNNNVNKKKKESLLKGVHLELKKVTWPSKKNIIKYSLATLAFCIILMLFFQLMNLGLSVVKGVFN